MRSGSIETLTPSARRHWAAARVWAAHQAPYLATALLALDPIVMRSDGAVGADLRAFPIDEQWHVYIDPQHLETVEVPEVGFWLLHQVTHLLRHHAARSLAPKPTRPVSPLAGRDGEQLRWNTATDAEINDDLRAGDAKLPTGAITPSELRLPDGWTAEQYWDALDGTPRRDQSRPEPSDCGSGCDGRPRPWDKSGGGVSDVEQMLVERDVARRIREHARRRGVVPAGWERWADDVLEPTVNWRRALASAVRHGAAEVAGRVDFTYRKPSRRAAATPDVVMPSLRQPLPTVAIVIDTSGSMSDDMLAQALGEVSGVLRSLGVARRSLRVVCCDAQAYEAQRAFDPKSIRLLGGGGTDMGAGIAAAVDLRPRPDLVIVLTDGHTPWPARAPDRARVIVGLMDRTGSVPPWATAITIESEVAGRW